MEPRKILTFVVIAALALGLSPLASSTTTRAPTGLSAAGQALWNFEALLRDTFGSRQPCEAGGSLNFVANGCAPLASYEPYIYVFADAHGSAYHLAAVSLAPVAFGNYPVPVRIDRLYVACNSRRTSYLIAYGDAAGFSFACLAPSP